GHRFSDVQTRDRKRPARRLQGDVGGIVRTNKEVRARCGELAGVRHEEASKLFIVAALPCVEHQGHRTAGHGDFGMHVRPELANALEACLVKAERRPFKAVGENADVFPSTVTLFARLRGWSTSVPLSTAT